MPDTWQPGMYTVSINVEGGIAGQKRDDTGSFIVEPVAPKGSGVIVDAKLFKKKKMWYWTEVKMVNVQGSGLLNKFVFEPTPSLQVTPIITTEKGYHCASTGNVIECVTGKPLAESKSVKFKVALAFTSIKWTAYDSANNVADGQTTSVRK